MDKTYIGYARVSTMEQNEARQLHSFEGYTKKSIHRQAQRQEYRPTTAASYVQLRPRGRCCCCL